MPGGLNLGGAFFTIYGDNEQVLKSMAQAKAAVQTATTAMANAQKAYADAAASSNASVINMNVQVAEQWVKTAQVASGAVRNNVAVLDSYGISVVKAGTASKTAATGIAAVGTAAQKAGQQAQQAGGAFSDMAGHLDKIGSTLATLTGFGAIASGALVVREAFLGLVDASQKLNQEQFRLQKLFGDMAPIFQRQAESLAALSGRSMSDAIAATNTFSTVQKTYGLSLDQVADIQQRVADAAAVTGVSLEEAAKRVAPALRGEAESIEFLGFSLQSDYLKALQDVTSAEYQRWQQMGPMQKTQILLAEFQKQSNEQTGAAAERAASAAGAFSKMSAAVENLQAKLGQDLNPQLVALANAVSSAAVAVGYVADQMAKLNKVAAEFANEKGIPAWLLAIPGAAPALAMLDSLIDNHAKKTVEAAEISKKAADDENAARAKAAADEKTRLGAANEERNNQIKSLKAAGSKALDDEIEAENKAYDIRKANLDAEKLHAQEAATAKKDAALAAIAAEKQASEDLYKTRLAHLEGQKQTALQVAQDTKDAALKALAAEKDAVEHASAAQQRAINDREQADHRAADDKLRTTKDELEAEDHLRDAARVAEDRALEDQTTAQKRQLQDRHKALVEAIQQEEDAVKAGAEKQLRAVEEQGKKADKHHADALRRLEEQNKAAEKVHDAAMRALDAESTAAQKTHDATLRAIADETDAAQKKHDQTVRGLKDEQDAAEKRHKDALDQVDAEQKAAETKHTTTLATIAAELDAAQKIRDDALKAIDAEQKGAEVKHDTVLAGIKAEADAAEKAHTAAVRAIDTEQKAAETRHTTIIRGIADEQDAAEAAHTSVLRGLDDELAAAKAVHDAAKKAIDERKRAEDERHRAALANQDDELRQQLAFVDASLAAADAAVNAQQHANKMADLQDKLKKAQSTGNAAEIASAERDIQNETADVVRDGLKEQLQAKRDALVAAGKLAKDAADDEHQHVLDAITDQQDLADAQLAAVQTSVAARKQAADDELNRIKTVLDARKQAADDELAAVKAVLDGRKQAADDEYTRIKGILDARKEAADAELKQVKDALDARKAAVEEQFKQIKDLLDGRKAAADAEYQLTKDVLQGRKDAADEELRKIKDVLDAKHLAADDELARIKDLNDKHKTAADDELTRTKELIAGKKLALDDQKAKEQEVFDDAKTKLADRETAEKEALGRKKLRIEDERDAHLKALDVKKKREEDDNTELERRDADALTEVKRKIADRRTTEDVAAKAARDAAEETHRLEVLAITDTKDKAIQASKDALDAYHTNYGLRTTTVNEHYNNEKRQIEETFSDPETGLIPKLKKAYDDTKTNYDLRTTEVNKQYKNEQDAIKATFDDPQTGLLPKLKNVHDATIEGLKDTKKDWEENFQKPILDVAGKTFAEIQKLFDELSKKNKLDVKGGGAGDAGDTGGGGAGPAPKKPGTQGGYYTPVVENASSDSYNTSGGTHGGFPAADIFARVGSPIHAPVGGRMESATYPKGGNAGWLYGDDGLVYYFAHAERRMQEGKVEAGDRIGFVGMTGNAPTPHLHMSIAKSAEIISARDGSGDRDVPSSFWQGGAEGPAGGDGGEEGDRDLGNGMRIQNGKLVFTLFGHEYTIPLPDLKLKGSALLAAIEKLGRDIGGKEFGRVAAAVADSEGADGDLTKPGAGGARGPFQFDPGGMLNEYADYLHMSKKDAGDFAGTHPLHAARWALEGYLGDAIKAGQAKHLEGPDLAVYASRYGQRPQEGLEERAGDSYRKLYGYARGGYIPEPTLLVGRTLGPYAVAGEMAPEWVTPQAPGPQGMRHTTVEMPILIGNREVERLWIDGYNLNVQRGRQFAGTVPR